MKTVYLDCQSGISGDMTLAALVDLGVPCSYLNDILHAVLPHVRMESESVQRGGFRATHLNVIAPHEHEHRHLQTILDIFDKAGNAISERTRYDASQMFRILAEAEAKVHGTTADEVHFHEVGAADSIADILCVAAGIDFLGIERFFASHVPTGTGFVKIAHGRVAVPAPATAELLRGMPLAPSEVPFELTTPTGAAILKYYVPKNSLGGMPNMKVEKIGVGAGSRDLKEQPNILRIMYGELIDGNQSSPETVWLVETNIDDMSGQLIGYCVERLWTLHPLDVWTTAITMKKQRPGVMISVLCRQEQIAEVESILFRETTTLGVRRRPVERTVLQRKPCKISTEWGEVDGKSATLPDGTETVAFEYESARQLALDKGVPLRFIRESDNEPPDEAGAGTPTAVGGSI